MRIMVQKSKGEVTISVLEQDKLTILAASKKRGRDHFRPPTSYHQRLTLFMIRLMSRSCSRRLIDSRLS